MGRKMEGEGSELQQHHDEPHQQLQGPEKCPRCSSMDIKFGYYNNNKVSQPRYFCKNCKKYWTHGGITRNLERKEERAVKRAMESSSSSVGGRSMITPQSPLRPTLSVTSAGGNIHRTGKLNLTRPNPTANHTQIKFVRMDINDLSFVQGFKNVLNPSIVATQAQSQSPVQLNHQFDQYNSNQAFAQHNSNLNHQFYQYNSNQGFAQHNSNMNHQFYQYNSNQGFAQHNSNLNHQFYQHNSNQGFLQHNSNQGFVVPQNPINQVSNARWDTYHPNTTGVRRSQEIDNASIFKNNRNQIGGISSSQSGASSNDWSGQLPWYGPYGPAA